MQYIRRTFIFAAALSLYSAFGLREFIAGKASDTLPVIAELGMAALILGICFLSRAAANIRAYAAALVVTAFLWVHGALLGIIISGIYIIFLILLGELILMAVRRRESLNSDLDYRRYINDFLAGSCAYISFIAAASAFGAGAVEDIRLISVFTAAAVFILYIYLDRAGLTPLRTSSCYVKSGKRSDELIFKLMSVFVIVMLLMQAGRMNIAIDYDSLHYGLRTPYILDNGYGIYENLGFVNDVYTYPKGLEVLLIPLNFDISYGAILGFSWWMGAGALYIVYRIVEEFRGRYYGMAAACVLSAIPGIMNMSVSAKTDMITLVFQLTGIANILYALRAESQRGRSLAALNAAAAILGSLTLKPTAVFFSGAVFMAGAVYIIYIGIRFKYNIFRGILERKLFILPACALAAFVMISARTFIITGHPITSMSSHIWSRLGLKLQYPFAMLNGTAPLESGNPYENLLHFLKRLYGIFLSPGSEGMEHIIIAAPTVLVPVLILGALINGRKRDSEDRAAGFINMLLWLNILLFLISSYMLYQVDGNYFMLLYAVSVIAFFINTKESAGISFVLQLPAVIFAAMLCIMTNWAGVSGFTPYSMAEYGYVNHRELGRRRVSELGGEDIYNYLKDFKGRRVLAMSWQPDCFLFPANVQSYTDLTGSCGNVLLVKTLDNFKGFLDYVGTGYIITENSFLEDHDRAAEIVGYMLEDGSLEEINLKYEPEGETADETDKGEFRLYRYNNGR